MKVEVERALDVLDRAWRVAQELWKKYEDSDVEAIIWDLEEAMKILNGILNDLEYGEIECKKRV